MQATARKITAYITEKNVISSEESDVFFYGMEVLLSSGGFIILALLLGHLTGIFKEVLLYLFAFMPIRSCIGGYHASTPGKCQLLSLITAVFAIYAGNWLDITMVPILTGVALLLIFRLAPVIHPQHPFSIERRHSLKKRARIIAGVETLLVLLMLGVYPKAAGIMASAFLLASLGIPLALWQGQAYGKEAIK